MRKARLVIDFLEGHEFEGYTRGEEWNGFACPYFTFEQARRVADAWHEVGSNAVYDSDNDRFSFQMDNGEMDSFPLLEIDGMKVYAIGNGCWIWEEVGE